MQQVLKQELKELAERIRKTRPEMKQHQREHHGDTGTVGWCLEKARYEFRHKHIARCLLRGRTIEQIEKVCYTRRNDEYIEKLMAEHGEETPNETLCASAG